MLLGAQKANSRSDVLDSCSYNNMEWVYTAPPQTSL